jgi:hypothetical protein
MTRKLFDWSKISKAIFTGWEVREKIFRPVIVNLLTASLIFLAVVIFKDTLYDYFAPRSQSNDWPIYCVVEPEVGDDKPVTAELFVINLTNTRYDASQLETLATQQSPERGKKLTPIIEVAMKAGEEKFISDIQPDNEYNKEKGSAGIIKVDPSHWQIRLDVIEKGKMLKFIIQTTDRRTVTTRADFDTLPIEIIYARSQ